MGHRNDAHVRGRMSGSICMRRGCSWCWRRSARRWRLLVGGLAGCGLGSYLLVDLGIVDRKPVHHRPSVLPDWLIALGTFVMCGRRSQAKEKVALFEMGTSNIQHRTLNIEI